ncbi:hypothetical protein NZD89_08725 [Alicyclobacillus fastidiosus]|uniref:DoxX family protein n=1 Tax=Alicyclobacillus fastidiosus TaxID=392011 RepID=A0ABY6ZKW7_9BACL|nr:hypothetical protein [Alicyclobacillus fastidiosus]WAH43450.1 hypothetical protein NZD89_08725 [Alicyclobacillus fastidiosus]GMA59603.1 hypothetical protein GCM10025859_00430 [Alicyclobacillus fastidiosus]
MSTGMSSSMKMNMGHGAGHTPMSAGISGYFAMVILAICAAMVLHIVFTLWKKQSQLGELSEHQRFRHSVPMTLGMIATMSVCTALGGVMENQLSAAYVTGLVIGILFGLLIGLPFRGMAALDGMVAGVMGGLMGTMLGSMMPQAGLYIVITVLTALFVCTWCVMLRRIYHPETALQVENRKSETLSKGKSMVSGARLAIRVRVFSIVFGLVWLVDAIMKWLPGFSSQFVMDIKMAGQGQPKLLYPWFHFWATATKEHPHFFVYTVAVLETLMAISLLFGFARKLLYAIGILLSITIWAVGEGFGGPYTSGATDIGTAIIYAFVFAAIWGLEQFSALYDKWTLDYFIANRWAAWGKIGLWSELEVNAQKVHVENGYKL